MNKCEDSDGWNRQLTNLELILTGSFEDVDQWQTPDFLIESPCEEIPYCFADLQAENQGTSC